MKILSLSILLASFCFSSSSQATCLSICSDTDLGVNFKRGGRVECKTQCCTPDGNCSEDVRTQKDSCMNGRLTEFFVGGSMGSESIQSIELSCNDACRTRQGMGYCRDVACNVPSCQAPPDGCHYERQVYVPGCGPMTCGDLVCDSGAAAN